jgi:hypothetical protein
MGHNVERLREQCITSQNGNSLAKYFVISWFSPSQIIVIECRQVVMNQCIGMNILCGNCKGQNSMPISTNGLSRRNYKDRP